MRFNISPYSAFQKVFQVSSPVRRYRQRQTVNVPAMIEALEPRQMLSASAGLTSVATMSSAQANQLTEAASPPSASPFSFTAAAKSSTEVTLSWTKVTGATGYVASVWKTNKWVEVARPSSAASSVVVSNLSPGTMYYFDVGVIKGTTTTWADPKSVVTQGATKPAAPTLTGTPLSSTQIKLTWNAVSGATGYTVYRSIGGSWVSQGAMAANATTLTQSSLTANTSYSYYITANNSAGKTASNTISVKTLAAGAKPAAPTLTGTALSSTQIKLNWNLVPTATGYTVYRSVNGSMVSQGAVGASVATFTASNLTANTSYSFYITANNTFGATASATIAVKTLAAATKPAAPILTGTALSSSQIKLTWNSVSTATGYTVFQSVNGSWVSQGSLGASATTATISSLTANTSYSFYVAASNAAGSTASATIAVKTQVAVTLAERPAADTAYTNVVGSLFGSGGPKYTDVQQGNVGDCWLLAAFAAVAAKNPGLITSMFTAAGTTVEQGQTLTLWKVRFYDSNNQAQYVTVDSKLPSGGQYYEQVQNGVMWVSLAEKAYAQANGKGYVTTQYVGQNSYAALDGGYPSWALQAISGLPATWYDINPTNMATAWNSGKFVVLGSSPNANNNLIVGDSSGTHAYALVGYSSSSGTPFTLYNPWGATTTLNGTIPYAGKQVYGGAFNASIALITGGAFDEQYINRQSPFKFDDVNEFGEGTIII